MGTAGCRSLGCSAGFACATGGVATWFLHIAPWRVFPRGECVAMVVVCGHSRRHCACQEELAAVQCSATHLGCFGRPRHCEEEMQTKDCPFLEES